MGTVSWLPDLLGLPYICHKGDISHLSTIQERTYQWKKGKKLWT